MATFLFALFLLFAAINIGYFLAFFKFSASESSEVYATSFPVSVIVCAKNEAENLQNFLPAILEQDYPDFEVIVINDASSDNTLDVIEEFQKIDPRIKIVNVINNEAFWANKKYALTLGIKKAQNEHLIFTDADCAPQSIHWLRHMTSGFTEEKSIVLGYGGYFKYKKSFINKLIRFETLLTAIQYFSYAKMGNPYMGVGRNLAYTSKQFYKQKGFASHLHVRSGDDDLFVNEAATNRNVSICDHTESITRSVPKTSITDWFRQKRRHASVAKFYKNKDKLLLGIFYSARLLFWIFLVMLLSLKYYWPYVIGALGLTLIIEGIVYFQSAKKLDERDIVWLFPILEPFLILSQLGIFIVNTISKPSHWK
ncbi:glycosyltransferase [Zunongwangia sp. HGR-M22]|uniref:glycosyltransferase n=1 Tax=Zunongwangia sp. HGR-M22 TaxID=3015168 RepID=UPI0022DD3CC0|nr:glycosyltransferase [Zunongwangia sp. HGR-M22]WBL26302.1 glycosyltransferase [Zunongwangia sp. HGR-M22]